MGAEINQVLASAVQILSEAVLLAEVEPTSERVIFVNRAFERLSGYSMNELSGRDLTFLQGPRTDSAHWHRLLRHNGEDGPADFLLYKKDGTPFWDRVSVSEIRGADKLYHVQVHADVSHQKEIEARFILAQKREATSNLVSGLAHDFNNLLTAILVYSGLLAGKVQGDAQFQRYVAEIRSSAERGSQLVAQLLNLGREDTAEPEIVDLRELVEAASDLLRRILGEAIRLTVQSDPELSKVRVHPGRIQQVLLNLAINSRDAMPDGGELVIRLMNPDADSNDVFPEAPPGKHVLLVVSDTGSGMNDETLANLFKPFFTTKGKGKGTGLGLFTIRTIVEQCNGRIRVESSLGKGASFRILLPAAAETKRAQPSRATVLLVEDDAMIRQSLQTTLSLRGYKILPASGAVEALQISRSHSGEIQLLLTDLVMASVNGSDLARAVRKVRPGIKVLFMSGSSSEARMGKALQQGSQLMKKPFTPSVLVEKIEELLNKPSKE